MKLKLFSTILGVVALAALSVCPAAAAVIFADNFNTPAFPTGTSIVTYAPGNFTTDASSGAGVLGWFVTGAGIDHVSETVGDVGSDGGAWVDLNSTDTGGMELAIMGAFTPGSNYTLFFNMNTAGAGAGSSINVEVTNGYAVTGFTPTTLATGTATPVATVQPVPDTSWQPYAINFTADVTNNIVIKLGSTGTGAVGPYIDNVVVLSNIPEPSTLILSGLGLIGFAMIRRRKA